MYSVYVNLVRHDLNTSAIAACGGLTEWLRSLIGNQVRRNSPVGSSPMSSANIKRTVEKSTVLFIITQEKGREPTGDVRFDYDLASRLPREVKGEARQVKYR